MSSLNNDIQAVERAFSEICDKKDFTRTLNALIGGHHQK